jgi:hypothetical protein
MLIGSANRRLRPLGHLTADAKLREISTCRIQLFLRNLQRPFKLPPLSNSTDKPPDFTMRTHGLWAHSRKGIEIPGRADGARCASVRFQCVGERVPTITAARVPNQTTSTAELLLTRPVRICLSP